jgi:hypothetical protein
VVKVVGLDSGLLDSFARSRRLRSARAGEAGQEHKAVRPGHERDRATLKYLSRGFVERDQHC